MTNLNGEILKLFKKLHVNIFHENVSKFQIYYSVTFFLCLSLFFSDVFSLSKLLCEIKQYSVENEVIYA